VHSYDVSNLLDLLFLGKGKGL